MADAKGVILAFLAAGKRCQAVFFLDRGDAVAAAGEDLVRIALVADIPHKPVVRRVEFMVQRHGQFHHAQARAEVAAGAGDGLDQVLAQLAGHGRQLVIGDAAQIGRDLDRRQVGVVGEVVHLRIVGPAAGRGKGGHLNGPGQGRRKHFSTWRTHP